MPIDHLRSEPFFKVTSLEDDADYKAFLSRNGRGIQFVPEPTTDSEILTLHSDFGDFTKWARQHAPTIPISAPGNTPKLVLRNADLWLPLAFLGDASVQVFLNLAASYLYERAKGALKNDQPRIHMRAIYSDGTGTTKKFEFSGDGETLAKAIKRFDLNNFFDESP